MPFSRRAHLSFLFLHVDANMAYGRRREAARPCDDLHVKAFNVRGRGSAGNVLREIYRISLENGSVVDVATGKEIPSMMKS